VQNFYLGLYGSNFRNCTHLAGGIQRRFLKAIVTELIPAVHTFSYETEVNV